MVIALVSGVVMFLKILFAGDVVYFVLAWFLTPRHLLMRFLGRAYEPLLYPIRAVMHRIFVSIPLDLSPVVLAILLRILGSALEYMAGIR